MLLLFLFQDLLETQGINEQLQRELEMQKRKSERQYRQLKVRPSSADGRERRGYMTLFELT